MSRKGTRRTRCTGPEVTEKPVEDPLRDSFSGCEGVGETLPVGGVCEESLGRVLRFEPNTVAAAARSGARRTPIETEGVELCPSEERRRRARTGDDGGLVPAASGASVGGVVET